MDSEKQKNREELNSLLVETGIKKEKLAELCDVTKNQVSRWCNGAAKVPLYAWSLSAESKKR